MHSPRCALPANQYERTETTSQNGSYASKNTGGARHRATSTPKHRAVTRRATLRTTALAGVLAGSLGAGLIGVAAPAAAAVPAAAKLSGATSVTTGSKATLHAIGSVNGKPAAYKSFSLQYQSSKGWRTVSTKKARPSGQLEWRVTIGGTSNWRVVLYVNGTQKTLSPNHHIRAKSNGSAVVRAASRQAGKPYRFGAAGPNSFDCSGLTQYVYRQFGKSLPHSATQQARYGRGVSKSAKQPGDLILFGGGGRYSHAGIYAGGNYMWDASTAGQPVAKRKIWSNRYVVRRLV
ncbi:C40 family peptidase [Cryptosporangium minutisporangium]|uniref:C40 family peptidase n=1 Tax=Cryptosporangium minutisporangium TaxID=113569 RepID=UPI0031EBE8EA